MKNNISKAITIESPLTRKLLIPGRFCQCSWASLNYNGDPNLAYCAKYGRIMDGWTVMNYCRGYGNCDR